MFYQTPRLDTDRLYLQKGTAEDFVRVYEYNFTKLRDIGGEFAYVKNDPALSASFATYSEEEENVYDWILYLRNTGEPVGNLVADRENGAEKTIELSFNLHPTHWGKEYMKEAVTAVLRFLFAQGYEAVIAGFDEGNRKSKRVQEKVGFVPYQEKPDSWRKNGVPITTYEWIMTKERFWKLYGRDAQ